MAGPIFGELGAPVGLVPNLMDLSEQYAGSCLLDFACFTACAPMAQLLRVIQISWTRTWVEKCGDACCAIREPMLILRNLNAPNRT